MRKALCVGINKFQLADITPLNGCVNDAIMLSSVLQTKYDYQVRLLTDEFATKAEILNRLEWLVDGATEDDTLVFARSSHGSWTVDKDFDERDFKDEVFVTYDYKSKELELIDDEIESVFEGCPAKVCHIIDTCCSGTAFRNGSNIPVRFLPPPPDIKNRVLAETKPKERTRPDNVMALAACADNEYALDLPSAHGGNGLFTLTLLQELKKSNYQGSTRDIFDNVARRVAETAKTLGTIQTPKLSCGLKQGFGKLLW